MDYRTRFQSVAEQGRTVAEQGRSEKKAGPWPRLEVNLL